MISQWEAEATRLGYPSEEAMWKALYPKNNLTQLSAMFGKAVNTIRERLKANNVALSPRGGANNVKLAINDTIVDDIVKFGVSATAKKLGIRPQVLYQRFYYSKKMTVKGLRAAMQISPEASEVASPDPTPREEGPASSTALPKSDHEPQV